jgi:uncharacterized HAD superfamily protein
LRGVPHGEVSSFFSHDGVFMIRFFFDVDGVLLDFETSYINVLKDYFHVEVPEEYQSTCWYLSDLFTDEQRVEGWDYFIGSEHFGKLNALIDPSQFNAVFGEYSVHLVTNIPPQYQEVRQKNLEEAGFHYESLHCGGLIAFDDQPTKKKDAIIRQLLREGESLFFMDDHPDNCVNVIEAFPEASVWLMSRPFNKTFEHPGIQRASHWDEVFEFTRQLVAGP